MKPRQNMCSHLISSSSFFGIFFFAILRSLRFFSSAVYSTTFPGKFKDEIRSVYGQILPAAASVSCTDRPDGLNFLLLLVLLVSQSLNEFADIFQFGDILFQRNIYLYYNGSQTNPLYPVHISPY